MDPLIRDFIVVIISLVLGSGVTAYIAVRRIKPEIDRLTAETTKLQSDAIKVKAEAEEILGKKELLEAQLYEQISKTVTSLLGPLNNQISMLQAGREEDRARIRQLESTTASQGVELVQKDCQIVALQDKVKRLEDELLDWKTGKKKKTGPLP